MNCAPSPLVMGLVLMLLCDYAVVPPCSQAVVGWFWFPMGECLHPPMVLFSSFHVCCFSPVRCNNRTSRQLEGLTHRINFRDTPGRYQSWAELRIFLIEECMQLDEMEVARGKRWFFLAGLVAVMFSVALFRVDEYLSNSPRDKNLGATLKELRTAQAGLPGRGIDERLGN
jgi:hypothetical protein